MPFAAAELRAAPGPAGVFAVAVVAGARLEIAEDLARHRHLALGELVVVAGHRTLAGKEEALDVSLGPRLGRLVREVDQQNRDARKDARLVSSCACSALCRIRYRR